jgi:hypothetical protein
MRELIEAELTNLVGILRGGREIPGAQFAAAKPGKGFDVLGRSASHLAELVQLLLSKIEITRYGGLFHLLHEGRGLG